MPMTPHPSIAAVIPTYNRGPLIGRAIDSVLAQRRPADETIVVDNGSSDDTEAIVRNYGEQVTFVRKEDGGASAARNYGVDLSGCDFVAFLDSDDYWHPEHLARVGHAITTTAARAVLYFADLEFNPPRAGHATAWQLSGFSIFESHEFAADAMPWVFRAMQPMWIQASVVNRAAYVAVGGCDEAMHCREDTHLFFKLALAGPMCAVAGIGGALCNDSLNSLTQMFSTAHPIYWRCTVRMYADVLASPAADAMSAEQRHELKRRLADGHFMLARTSVSRSPREALYHLHQAVRTDPSLVPMRVGRRLAQAVGLA
jgi:glycosyltransferase involved in cell wall biosynthesis